MAENQYRKSNKYIPTQDNKSFESVQSVHIDPMVQQEIDKANEDTKGAAKVNESKSWYRKLWEGLDFVPQSLLMSSNVALSTAQGVIDPQLAAPKIEKINFLSMAEFFSSIGRINPGTPTLLEAMGYTQPMTLSDKIAYGITNSFIKDDEAANAEWDSVMADNEKLIESLEAQKKERPIEINLDGIPGLKQYNQWVERGQGSGPNNWVSEQLQSVIDWNQKEIDRWGPISTGSKSADYLLNNVQQLAVSTIGSGGTSFGLAKLAGRIGKINRIANSARATKIAEKVSQAAIASVSIGGENIMEATQWQKNAKPQLIGEFAGKEYVAAREAAGEDAYQKRLDYINENNIKEDRSVAEWYRKEAMTKFDEDWLAERPKIKDEIDQHLKEGYQASINNNILNVAFELIPTGLFLRGQFPSRNILKKPTKYGLRDSELITSGIMETAQEIQNYAGEHAADKAARGKEYGMTERMYDVFSPKAAEAGFWGFVGGYGQGVLANRLTYSARLKQYEAQQKVIIEQDKIGKVQKEELLDNFTSLRKGLIRISNISNNITKLEVDEQTRELATIEQDKIVAVQAAHAFATGTTENLIKNYQMVAKNENFSDETRKKAEKAVSEIHALEAIYNDTRKYSNNDDVYYNRVNKRAIQNFLKENAVGKQELRASLMDRVQSEVDAGNIKLPEGYSVESLIDDMVNGNDLFEKNFNKFTQENRKDENYNTLIKEAEQQRAIYDKAIADINEYGEMQHYGKAETQAKVLSKIITELNAEHDKLISKKEQTQAHAMNAFYRNLEEKTYKLQKEHEKLHPKDKFDRYKSKEYEKLFDDVIKTYSKYLDKAHIESIIKVEKYNRNSGIIQEAVKKVFGEMFNEKKTQANANMETVTKPAPETVTNENIDPIDDFEVQVDILNEANKIADVVQPVDNATGDEKVANTEITEHDVIFADERSIVKDSNDPIDNESYDPIVLGRNMNEADIASFAKSVATIHELVGDNATFEDVVRYIARMKSLSKADKMFNGLVLGYNAAKLPGYDTNDYNQIYNKVFGDPIDQLELLILDHAAEKESNVIEQAKNNPSVETMTVRENRLADQTDKNGTPFTQDSAKINSDFATVKHQTLKVVVKEIEDENGNTKIVYENTDELTDNPRIQGQHRLLHPSKYNKGTKLTVQIADDFENFPVDIYNEDGTINRTVTFNEWLFETGYNSNSKEYWDKIPMTIVDQDGVVIGQVHDIDRITPLHYTEKSIESSREKTRSIRHSVRTNNGKTSAIVVNRTIGFQEPLYQPADKQAKKLSENTSHSNLGIATSASSLEVPSMPGLRPEQIVKLNNGYASGQPYELRQVGMIEVDGKLLPLYFPFGTVKSDVLPADIQSTLYWVINAYLNGLNPEYVKTNEAGDQIIEDNEMLQNIVRQITEVTKENINLKLADQTSTVSNERVATYQKLVDMLTYNVNKIAADAKLKPNMTSEAKARAVITLLKNRVESNLQRQKIDNGPNAGKTKLDIAAGTDYTYMFFQNGQIYAGTFKIDNVESERALSLETAVKTVLISNPVESNNNEQFLEGIKSILPGLKVNANMEGLRNSFPIPYFDEQGNLSGTAENYTEHLREHLRTFNNTIKLTSEFNGKEETFEASMVQPTIDIALENELSLTQEEIDNYNKEIIEQSTLNKLATKILAGIELTNVEQLIVGKQPVVKQIVQEQTITAPTTGSEQQLILYVPTGEYLTLSEINERAMQELERHAPASKYENEDEESNDPVVLTDEQNKRIVKANAVISGLTPEDFRQIIEYIYYSIASSVKESPSKSIDIAEIKSRIKARMDELLTVNKDVLELQLQNYQAMQESLKDNPEVAKSFDRLILLTKKDLEKLNLIKTHYDTFQSQAVEMAKKHLGLKKVRNTISEEDDMFDEDEEFSIAEGNEKEDNFSKTSMEVNSKDSVSADIRRFCQSIRDVNKNGQPKYGICGIDTYVGFDMVFNTVSALLSNSYSDYSVQREKLVANQEKFPWLKQVIEELDNAPKSLQNEFVHHMAKHSLAMEFVMYSKNRNGQHTLRVYNTNSSAVVQSIVDDWKEGMKMSEIISVNGSNEYIFNYDGIVKALEDYKELEGYNNHVFTAPQSVGTAVENLVMKAVKNAKNNIKLSTYFDGNTRELTLDDSSDAEIIKKHMKDSGPNYVDKVKIQVPVQQGTHIVKENRYLEIRLVGNKLKVKEFADKTGIEVLAEKFLANFGITLSRETLNEIINKKFIYDSKIHIDFAKQFDKSSTRNYTLFGTLAAYLESIKRRIEQEGTESINDEVLYEEDGGDEFDIMSQSIIKALATMESRYTPYRTVTSFYDNHKPLYGFTASKFITDRVRDLKDQNNPVIDELLSMDFNGNSYWLKLLKNDAGFREDFNVIHLGLTALKELGRQLFRDNSLQNLSETDINLVRKGFFESMKQGTVTDKTNNLRFRLARMMSPTMSNKSTMTIIKTAVLDYNYDMDGRRADVLEFMYGQVIQSELKRIIATAGKKLNVKGYDKGANMFFFLPALNDETVEGGKTFRELALEANDLESFESMNVKYNGESMTVKQAMIKVLDQYTINEQTKKLEQWEEEGFIVRKEEKGKVVEVNYFDSEYLSSRGYRNDLTKQVEVAAMDHVLNSFLNISNSFMAISGDPAQYYKVKQTTKDKQANTRKIDYVQIVDDTFDNVGKRLASMIAPGNKIADSDVKGNNYIQLLLEDNMSISSNIKYITRVLDNREVTDQEIAEYNSMDAEKKEKYLRSNFPKSKDYFNIESTNGQEYTTWKEHLYVLEKIGKVADGTPITQEEIDTARKIFTKEISFDKLSARENEIVSKILQPMKPVYTGQIKDDVNKVMRNIYIKTSSFPLIPQLTAGMEIDKLAKAMEDIERKTGKNVRAVHTSGIKVGNNIKPSVYTNIDGTFKDVNAESLLANSLTLPRSNFRIQQNVPYKSAKTTEDVVSMATQPVKLLFSAGVLDMTGFDFHGKPMTGEELFDEYTKMFNNLYETARLNLYEELGIDPKTEAFTKVTLQKIEDILKHEGVSRGYSTQALEGLGIDPVTQNFKIPLWLSPDSAKYEALLNSIVVHRVVKMKFPGYSYVVGSESGFKMKDDLDGIDQSRIVFTDKYDFNKGELTGTQVFIPMKFRVEGKLIDLFEKENGSYKWIIEKEVKGKKVYMLNTNKFDTSLLSAPSFRIPTAKHSMMENLEIAGFLPIQSADLMIVSKDGTVAMSEDYDIDKRYTYHPYTEYKNGKLVKLSIPDIDQQIESLEAKYDSMVGTRDAQNELRKEIDMVFDTIKYREEENADSDEALKNRLEELKGKLRAETVTFITHSTVMKTKAELRKLKQMKIKLLMNDIIDVHSSVLAHPEVKKMSKEKLSVDEARNNAEYLESITKKDDRYFTPLSDIYQTNRIISGATDKLGTAAYSLDVVTNAMFEQSAKKGNVITLQRPVKVVDPNTGNVLRTDYENFTVQFGTILSDGKLGQSKTLSETHSSEPNRNGERSIVEVNAERQNLMVDGETEKIAARVNLNDITMPVDKVLTLLGFDKGEDGRSISFLFLSQPIIKDYVEMMKMSSSNIAEYNANKQEEIRERLREKYKYDEDRPVGNRDKEMTNEKMIEQIKNGGQDTDFQCAVLDKFIELEKYGIALTAVQSSLNVDSKGIGKNMLETYEKLNKIMNLNPDFRDKRETKGSESSDTFIKNADKLIGDYRVVSTKEERDYLINKGFIAVDRTANGAIPNSYMWYMIKPTTIVGASAINGLKASTFVWGRFFPYNTDEVKLVFKEILSIIGNSNMRESRIIEIKKEIFEDMKKYFFTDGDLNITTLSAQEERARLFMDVFNNETKTLVHTSLARYMRNMKINGTPEVKQLLAKNKLISRLSYEIDSTGKLPSLIKFNASSAENFDDEYIYNAIIELMERKVELPDFNGKKMTSYDLAQELVTYSFMSGGVQKAIEFAKYIPVNYMIELGIPSITSYTKKRLGSSSQETGLTQFTLQYLQHHANRVMKLSPDMINNPANPVISAKDKNGKPSNINDLNSVHTFTYVTKEPPRFLTLYNEKLPKKQSKFQLYMYVPSDTGREGDHGYYQRIPVLGIFGMPEYQASNKGFYPSLINQKDIEIKKSYNEPTAVNPLDNMLQVANEFSARRFGAEKGNLKATLTEISKLNSPLAQVAKVLLPLIDSNTELKISNIDSNGSFKRSDNVITINTSFYYDENLTQEDFARTILRETVHSVTDRYISEFYDADGNLREGAKPTAPLKRLVNLFHAAQKELDKDGKLTEFKKKIGGNTTSKVSNDYEATILYAGLNIREFVERIMTTPELQKRLNVEYHESGETINEKIWKFIKDVLTEMLEKLGIDITTMLPNGITAQSIMEIMNVADEAVVFNQKKSMAEGELITDYGDPFIDTMLFAEDEQGGISVAEFIKSIDADAVKILKKYADAGLKDVLVRLQQDELGSAYLTPDHWVKMVIDKFGLDKTILTESGTTVNPAQEFIFVIDTYESRHRGDKDKNNFDDNESNDPIVLTLKQRITNNLLQSGNLIIKC